MRCILNRQAGGELNNESMTMVVYKKEFLKMSVTFSFTFSIILHYF